MPERLPLCFSLDPAHEAHEPPEARDGVRLMVSRGDEPPTVTTFRALPDLLEPGDLLVVNTSATIPAAIDAELPDGRAIVLHLSTELPGGLWMVEPRRPIAGGATAPLTLPPEPVTLRLAGLGDLELLRPAPYSTRLWLSSPADGCDLLAVAMTAGRPIRYSYVPRDWPIDTYRTVFSGEPGSAEMPSASRPFTDRIVTRLVNRGVALAPILLHTGVSSLERHELPYPERYAVPAGTAARANAVHRAGGRVVAVGTTVVRALETVTDATGTVHPNSGWTDTVITPERGVRAVDGLVTGWHEPEATHLAMLEAIAGRPPLQEAYEAAFAEGFLWHEFGDSHLILPDRPRR
jgi:S-adenosylmethionine:tRNA ribosyltransferase-isomerase